MEYDWKVAADFGEHVLWKFTVGKEVPIIGFTSEMRENGRPERFIEPVICVVENG